MISQETFKAAFARAYKYLEAAEGDKEPNDVEDSESDVLAIALATLLLGELEDFGVEWKRGFREFRWIMWSTGFVEGIPQDLGLEVPEDFE